MDVGYSSYNSLQLEAKHQIAHGLMLDVFYTWSKALEVSYFNSEHNQSSDTDVTNSVGDQINLHNDRRYGLDDIPDRFVANVVYELPFGTGHSLNPGNKVASYLTSGWSIGATEMDESGYPLDIYDDDAGALNARPDRVAGEPLLVPKTLQQWYNGKTQVTLPDGQDHYSLQLLLLEVQPGCLHRPLHRQALATAGKYINDTYWMGQSALNYSTIRDPSINNLNFTIKRNFKVTEKIRVELAGQCDQPAQPPQYQDLHLGSGWHGFVSQSNASTNTSAWTGIK